MKSTQITVQTCPTLPICVKILAMNAVSVTMKSLSNAAPRALSSGVRIHRGRDARRGFTLVELLMAIAIVGLLASLLLPVLGRANSKAKAAGCKSNLRQLGLAMQLYVSDSAAFPSTVAGKVWPWHLAPYMSEHGLYVYADHDPYALSNSASGFVCPRWVVPEVGYGYNGRGYARMGLDGHSVGTGPPVAPVRESDVAAPADMIALGDNVSSDVHGNLVMVVGAIERALKDVAASPNTSAWTKRYRTHDGFLNLVFCDGHVEANSIFQLHLDERDASLRRWNRDNEPHRDKLKDNGP